MLALPTPHRISAPALYHLWLSTFCTQNHVHTIIAMIWSPSSGLSYSSLANIETAKILGSQVSTTIGYGQTTRHCAWQNRTSSISTRQNHRCSQSSSHFSHGLNQ